MEATANQSTDTVEQKGETQKPEKNLKGLGGWLILVGIGVVFAPIRVWVNTVPLYKELFQDGGIEILTSEISPYYHPMWGPFLYSEMLGNALIFFWSVALVYLFFAKKTTFPKAFIYLHVFSFVFVILDVICASLLMPEAEIFDRETIRELIKVTVGVAIWVPYMKMSKRVEQTFVR